MDTLLHKRIIKSVVSFRSVFYFIMILLLLIGQFGFAVGKAAASAPAVAIDCAVETGRTQIRWFVGLGAGTHENEIIVEQDVVNDFNNSQSTICLTLEVVPNDRAINTLTGYINSGTNIPDIVGPVGWAGANAFYDKWQDLKALPGWAGYDTSQFPTTMMNWYDDATYGQIALPFATYPSAIFYNPALFDNAGLHYPPATYGAQYQMPDNSMVDWNWNTVQQVSKLLTLDNTGKNSTQTGFDKTNIVQYGFSFGWEDKPSYWGAFWQNGTLLGGTAGNYTAQTPASWKASWQWVSDGIWGDQPFIPNATVSNSPEFGSSNVFDSGKIAMLENPMWYLCCTTTLIGQSGTFQFGAMPSYNGTVAGRVDADTIRILKDSTNKDAAFEALKYLAGTGVDKLIVGSAGNPPAYGALPAISSKQATVLAQKAVQFPFVTQASWDILLAGTNYIDDPSAEAFMPYFPVAWDRLIAFGNDLRTYSCFDVDAETTRLEADLQASFNGIPTLTGRVGTSMIAGGQIAFGSELPGVTMTYEIGTPPGAPQTTITNCTGSFSMRSDAAGSTVKVTPSKTGYNFGPPSITYTNLSGWPTNNYIAMPIIPTISGNVGMPGVTVSHTGGAPVISAANGSYSFTVPYNWTGTVTPSKAGYTFGPANKVYAAGVTSSQVLNFVTYMTITGNVGVAGATLTGGVAPVVSTATGTYTVKVPYNFTGKITPTKAGLTFTPAFKAYTSIKVNQTLQNYSAISTFTSTAANDGWILESTATSSVGGTMNAAATTINLGDDAAKKQYDGILSFVTGPTLPDNAIITAVTLKVKQQAIVGTLNPVTTFQGFMADIKTGMFNLATLEAKDFQTAATATYGPFVVAPVTGWYSLNLTPGSLKINKLGTAATGLTQIRLRFKLADNANAIANYLAIYSGNAGVASAPQLIITYRLP